MSLPAAVLWDLDGTLIDSEPLWLAAETDLLAGFGRTWTPRDHAELVGMPLLTAAGVLRGRGVDLSPEAIVARLVAGVHAALQREVPWQPGVLELLAELSAAGVPSALVTMSYRNLAQTVVDRAPAGAFAVVVAGDEVVNGKPHPESYLTAADRLGVDVAKCVAIEDSVPGIAAALASGARTVGVQQIVPVPAQPGLSRVSRLDQLRLADLGRLVDGETVDLLA